MSGPKGQMTHPDSDVLAEFRAGLMTGRRGARISAHLATCERCAGLCDQLTEIPTLLAAVPAPAMPDAVVQRLEIVLAAEAAQRQHSSERAVGDSAPDRVPGPPPRRRWDFRLVALRVLAPAAAVVLLAAGGYSLSRIGSSPTSSGPSAASAASQPVSAPAAVPSTAPVSHPGGAPAFEGPAKFAVVTSATNYYRATLVQQLERELRRYARTTGSTQEFGLLRGCVHRVTADTRPGTLLLVEKAYYQGNPAIVIVARSGLRDAAWVTTPACSANGDHVLATTTLPGTSAL